MEEPSIDMQRSMLRFPIAVLHEAPGGRALPAKVRSEVATPIMPPCAPFLHECLRDA
jgi:hypothetical protein